VQEHPFSGTPHTTSQTLHLTFRILYTRYMASKPDPKLKRAGVSGYNKPKRLPAGSSKKFIVVAKQGNTTKTIRFGDPKMTIKKDQPARRKSFRARHKCDSSPPSKLTARYWSCKKW